jgi:hypothetical protein
MLAKVRLNRYEQLKKWQKPEFARHLFHGIDLHLNDIVIQAINFRQRNNLWSVTKSIL